MKKWMKIIKKIHKYFERFFYQEKNFNFSYFRKKLKFYLFNYLKFCFNSKTLNSKKIFK